MVATMVEIGWRAGTDCADQRASASAPVNSCIAHPPAFPGLELAVPHDAAAGIETLVEHALGDTVAGIEHGLLDLPTPDSLNAETVFGPSYSRLTKTGLDDATAKGIARWGGAVFFISNHLAEAREQMAWHADDRRAVERRKAKDAIDTRLASRLAGQWGGTEGAQAAPQCKSMPGAPNRRSPTVAPSTPGWRWRRSKGG